MFKFTKVTIVYDDRQKKLFHSISLHFISYIHIHKDNSKVLKYYENIKAKFGTFR